MEGDDVSIEDRRVSARRRLRRRFGSTKSDAELAKLATTHVHEAACQANGGSLSEEEVAQLIAEDARQMRAEKRAGQHVS